MKYTWNQDSYNKRGLTENIIFKVIANDYKQVKIKAPEYTEAAASLKNAELTGQQDACPVVGRDELKHVIISVRTLIPELRARHTQTGTAVSAAEIADVTEEDALFQIVNGTYINVSSVYDEKSRNNLLAKGILPLYSEEVLPEGTIIFVQGILDSIRSGRKDLTAYRIAEHEEQLVPIKLQLAVNIEEIPDTVLKDN